MYCETSLQPNFYSSECFMYHLTLGMYQISLETIRIKETIHFFFPRSLLPFEFEQMQLLPKRYNSVPE